MAATHLYAIDPNAPSKVIEFIDIASIGGGLADNAATNAKLADMATQRIITSFSTM